MSNDVKTINLQEADLDKPLFRIYPIWYFDMALTINQGNLALVRPSAWEDPHEAPCARMHMSFNGDQKSLGDYLQPAYAQCWSFEGQSDALMRAYSRVSKDHVSGRNTEPKFEGVKAQTTPRLIINAVQEYLNKRENIAYTFYVAKVLYIDDPAQSAVDQLAKVGPTQLGSGHARASSLSFKRKAFEHEQEVRIIALATAGANHSVVHVDIEPNKVFQEVSFDPRLNEFERKEREARIKSFGYTGKVGIDHGYIQPIFQVRLTRHWDELDAPKSG